MTQDFSLKQTCPHYVVKEWLGLELDLQSIYPLKNPSSRQVELRRNGLLIPNEGVHAPIRITSSIQGPFTIVETVNDMVRFQVNQGAIQTAYLPIGSQVRASAIAESLTDQTFGMVFSSKSGRLHITSEQEGVDATFYLRAGTAHLTLGLPESRFYRGRIVTPGWSLVKDSTSVDELNRHVRFKSRLRSTSDIWELSYYTRRQECRRCSGLGQEYDIRFDSHGDPVMVTGIYLLAQEVEKITFTIRGSNVFYDWYGTSIMDLIGSKIVRGGSLIETQLVSEISNTLERFRSVKAQQASLQPVGDAEYFLRLQNLSVIQDPNDPTVFRIRITIQNAVGETSDITQNLRLSTLSDTQLVG